MDGVARGGSWAMQLESIGKQYENGSKGDSWQAGQQIESGRRGPRNRPRVVTFYVASCWSLVVQQVAPGLAPAVPGPFRG